MVASIAVHTGFPPELVRESYLELSADARVHMYLPLFAAKRTIARLRSLKSDATAQTPANPDAARDDIPSGTRVAAKSQDFTSLTLAAQPATGAGRLTWVAPQWYQTP
ncbi:DUF3562 domain-containing protein [Cupriavidus sp. KK10]|jgi:hypothetical protein|uniref:DUF3562 domain-containing protein n=1 Tax=Cupriavidus sp. KK10 TaxID=1478019 RepID=UPI002010FD96|nr:DUF3562 domain-containing protein [Cupriavidus sp. KK10]